MKVLFDSILHPFINWKNRRTLSLYFKQTDVNLDSELTIIIIFL